VGSWLLLRNWKVSWVLSIAFEFYELTFAHWLRNSGECWWGHVSAEPHASFLAAYDLEFKGSGINNLSEEDMNTLTHKIEEILLKEALSNEDSSQWATNKMEKNKILLTEREEKEKNGTPKENEGKLIPQTGLSKYEQSIGLKRRRGTRNHGGRRRRRRDTQK
jgi:hypothetical protein